MDYWFESKGFLEGYEAGVRESSLAACAFLAWDDGSAERGLTIKGHILKLLNEGEK